MKKIVLIVAVVGLAMASCKKDRTCKCTTTSTDNNGNVSTGTEHSTVYHKVKKGDAKDICVSTTTEQTITTPAAGTSKDVTSCTLS